MKTLLSTAAALLLLSTVAHAETSATQATDDAYKYPPSLPSPENLEAVDQAMFEAAIEAKGWCAQSLRPVGKSGQPVIYYTRDKSGRCTAVLSVVK